jgi:hypothetical protein
MGTDMNLHPPRLLWTSLLLVLALAVLARVFETYLAPDHVVDWLLMYSLCT